MLKYLPFIALFLCPAMLDAQTKNAWISVSFLYQKNEPFTLAQFENVQIEEEGRVIADTLSDNDGNLTIQVELKRPEILILRSIHDEFKIYCTPEDTIKMVVVNKRNVQFYGPRALENNLLYSSGFQSDFLPPGESNLSLTEILTKYDANAFALQNNEFSDDFISFFKAENIGKKYFNLYALRHKTKSIEHFDLLNEIEAELLKFKYEPILDESRSRLYLNALYLLQDVLIDADFTMLDNEKDGLWKDYPYANAKKRALFYKSYPNLRKIFHSSAINTLIYRAEDTTSLFYAIPFMAYYKESFPDSYINEVLKKKFDEKRLKLTLTSAYDFTAYYSDGSICKLSTYKGKTVLLYYWATWCKPCLESLPELESLVQNYSTDNSFVVLAVNIRDSKAKWKDYLQMNVHSNLIHIHLNHDESNIVFDKYSFQSVPNYVLLGKEFEILIPGKNKLSVYDELLISSLLRQ